MADQTNVRAVREPPLSEAPLQGEIATFEKDIDLFSGYLNRLENPDPVLRTEAGGKGLKLYDEVERDAHAGSVLQTRYLAVVGKEWEVLPAEPGAGSGRGRPRKETQEQRIAEFVKKCFLGCNFDQFRQELLGAILYGYHGGEVIWRVNNGQVVIDRLRAKHPRRFVFTPEREPRLLTLANMIEGEPVPDRKFIFLAYGSSDNPYGKGLGQSLWWPVWFKKNGVKFWLIFSEKFGSPTPVGKYPPGSTPAQKQTLLDAINSIQQETGITIPEGMAIDLLEATRTGTVNTYETLCNYMDKQISKRVLGQTATTEGTPGKLGNEDSQEKVREDIIKADADLLAECLNNTLVKWLVDLNFGPQAAYPKFWIRCDEEEDLKPLAERDSILVKDIGLPVTKKYFYETYAIPEPEEGEELVSVPIPPQAGPPPGAGMPKPAPPGPAGSQPPSGPGNSGEYAESNQDNADRIAGNLADRAMQLTDPWVKEIETLAASSKSLEDFQGRLLDLYGKMDLAELGNLMARALSVADLVGRWEVSTENESKKKAQSFAEDIGFDMVFGKPFEEQVEFFRGKTNIPTRKWNDLWKDQHAKGFMVAGAYRDDLLADFRQAVDGVIAEGRTLEQFRDDFDRIVKKHGWSYNGSRNWRSEVIYSTNVRTAYAAGRWKQMTDPEVLEIMPYLEYRHGDSRHPRPLHLSWNGLVLPADDPFWKTHYPPNGWGCKCRVFSASERDRKKAAQVGKDEAPDTPIDPKTGAPEGIDPGWDYNVGEAAFGKSWVKIKGDPVELGPYRMDKYPGLTKKLSPVLPPLGLGPRAKTEGELRSMITEGVWEDPLSHPVTIGQGIAEHILAEPQSRWDGREQYFPLIPDVIENPQEIWVGFMKDSESGKVFLVRRYAKAYQIGKGRVVGVLADEIDGALNSFDLFRSKDLAGGRLRSGRLIFHSGEVE